MDKRLIAVVLAVASAGIIVWFGWAAPLTFHADLTGVETPSGSLVYDDKGLAVTFDSLGRAMGFERQVMEAGQESAETSPPSGMGVRFGSSPAEAEKVLGRPELVMKTGELEVQLRAVMERNRLMTKDGLVVTQYRDAQLVSVLVLMRPFRLEGGVGLGDTRDKVEKVLGKGLWEPAADFALPDVVRGLRMWPGFAPSAAVTVACFVLAALALVLGLRALCAVAPAFRRFRFAALPAAIGSGLAAHAAFTGATRLGAFPLGNFVTEVPALFAIACVPAGLAYAGLLMATSEGAPAVRQLLFRGAAVVLAAGFTAVLVALVPLFSFTASSIARYAALAMAFAGLTVLMHFLLRGIVWSSHPVAPQPVEGLAR